MSAATCTFSPLIPARGVPGDGFNQHRTLKHNRHGKKLNSLPYSSNFYRPEQRADKSFNYVSIGETHLNLDTGFIQTLTQLYRERIPPASRVLDVMTSLQTHLPTDVFYSKVIGHGLDARLLSRNRSLDSFIVQDINSGGELRFQCLRDCSFDAVLCANGVQYMRRPGRRVFPEFHRLLRPGGVCIISFSNSMESEKTFQAAWRSGSSNERIQLVIKCFDSVKGFSRPEVVKKMPGRGCEQHFVTEEHFNMFRTQSCHPFYAVIAHREQRET